MKRIAEFARRVTIGAAACALSACVVYAGGKGKSADNEEARFQKGESVDSNYERAVGTVSSAAEALERLTPDPRLGEAVDTVCFTGGLAGFYEIETQAVVLRRSPGDAYLVRTGHCPNLKSVEGLRITDPSKCLKRGDRLEVYDTQFPREGERSGRPDRCLVLSINKWREDAESNP